MQLRFKNKTKNRNRKVKYIKMELFEKLSKLNDLTEELLAKAEIYRNDPHGAKIKPE